MGFIEILLSLVKTIHFNLANLPLKQALRLPVFIHYTTHLEIKGNIRICLDVVSPAMIRIGFHTVPVCNPNDKTSIVILENGVLCFEGTAHIGRGSKLFVGKTAYLNLGDNFAISASSSINCHYQIVFGKDIQFSWDCLVMDSDTHYIFGKNGIINKNKEVVFGDKIWIGCRSTILKGSIIPSNCVIGACSFIAGSKFFRSNSIIAGAPAKSIKDIINWKL